MKQAMAGQIVQTGGVATSFAHRVLIDAQLGQGSGSRLDLLLGILRLRPAHRGRTYPIAPCNLLDRLVDTLLPHAGAQALGQPASAPADYIVFGKRPRTARTREAPPQDDQADGLVAQGLIGFHPCARIVDFGRHATTTRTGGGPLPPRYHHANPFRSDFLLAENRDARQAERNLDMIFQGPPPRSLIESATRS